MKTTSIGLLALAVPAGMLADTRPIAAPELNPASAGSAVAILVGFGLMLRDRFLSR
jgi:hypothetical protein